MHRHQILIDQALEHIKSQQSPNGGFINLSGFSASDFSEAIAGQTTFFASNILACLQNIPFAPRELRASVAGFLLSEKNERWSFNYWARCEKERIESPYQPCPDDLDDTFAAIAAIALHDPTLIDAHVFSAIAKMLTAREIREGGPYGTWLVPDEAAPTWQNVDLVVNSTIGYALSLIDVRVPNVDRFISDSVEQGRLTSPYYPDIFHIIYFLSRFYGNRAPNENADIRSKLTNMIDGRIQENGAKGMTVLEHSMAISALVNLGYTERILPLGDLLADRLEDEGFRPYAFCIDPSRNGRRCYAGASALTAAFAAEALARCSIAILRSTPDGHSAPTAHDHIRSLARMSYQSIGSELREMALAKTAATNDERVTTLTYDFRDILCRNGKFVPEDIVERLSVANLYGWMAYDIYDDVLDGDVAGSFVPCANFFLRSLDGIYHELSARIPGITSLLLNTMNKIDSANAWEQKYCCLDAGGAIPAVLPDFADYRTLADRSIGHAMGPLAVLLFAGYRSDSGEYKNCEAFFRHYLIARQLHDDAHDWTDDLLRGRVNSVAALILARYKEEYSKDPSKTSVSAATIMPTLHKIFWKEVIDEIASLITSRIAEARTARQNSSILDGSDFIESDLRRLEAGALRAIRERDEALVFLADYMASTFSGAQ